MENAAISYRRSVPTQPAVPPVAPAFPEPKPDRLMKAVAFMVLTYVWRIQDAFPVLGKIQLPLISAFLAIILLLASRDHPWRKLDKARGPILYCVFAWFFLMVCTVPTSLWRTGSALFLLKDFLPNMVLMGLIATTVRSTKDVEWYCLVNIAGAFVYCVVVNLFFHMVDGRYGNLIYYDANDFSLVVICTIPFAIYFLRKGTSTIKRLFALAALGFFMISIVRSGSRGGFIGFVPVMAYILLRFNAIPARTRLTAAVAGLTLFTMVAGTAYWDKVRSIAHPTEDYNWTDPFGRRQVWLRGLGYMLDNPILGVGISSFPEAEGHSDIAREFAAEGRGFKWSVAHNSFVEVGAETGFPGLITFLTMLGITFWQLGRVRARGINVLAVGTRERALAQMLIGSFIGFVFAGIFVSAEYFSYLYMLFGLAVGLLKLVRLRRNAILMAPPAPPPVRLVKSAAESWSPA